MKTIGLIGGMSWESTDIYYQQINRLIQKRCGGLHSAQVILYSVDFAEIESYQQNGEWRKAGECLGKIAKKLETCGADAIALCTNTMHKVAEQIECEITIPFLHIADATIHHIKKSQLNRIGLLGTRFTMEQSFLIERFNHAGIEIILPSDSERKVVHSIIYEELCQGRVEDNSKTQFKLIIDHLRQQQVTGVILGCTEIGMLIQQKDVDIPLFDTTHLHIQSIVDFLLSSV